MDLGEREIDGPPPWSKPDVPPLVHDVVAYHLLTEVIPGLQNIQVLEDLLPLEWIGLLSLIFDLIVVYGLPLHLVCLVWIDLGRLYPFSRFLLLLPSQRRWAPRSIGGEVLIRTADRNAVRSSCKRADPGRYLRSDSRISGGLAIHVR